MSALKQLIHQIHRRSLWQVLGIYLVASWIVFQVIQTLTEGLGLPEWFPALAVVLLLIGLPVVLATAFVQEGVARGAAEPRQSDETEAKGTASAAVRAGDEGRAVRRLFTWRHAITGGVLAFALWGVVAGGWLLLGGRTDQESVAAFVERKSVAVLPFANISADPENAYFSDGITGDIITHLSKIADLKVISRTSVMQYKNSEKNLREIGEELGVAVILEGEVQRVRDRVRINAQLIDAETDEHLWAEQYNRQLADVFAIQSDVAQHIAAALKATLTPAEKDRIEATPTENLQAYEFYLRGNAYYNRPGWLRANFQNARQMYEKAVALDPGFALAHARLSMINSRLYHFFYDRSDERLRQARAAVDRALELGPALPETHLAFAYYHYWGHRAYERALTELAIAQGGLPGNAELHEARGYIYRRQGKWEGAIASLKQVATLDPRDAVVLQEIGGTYNFLRRYAEAERYFERALALVPDNVAAAIEKAWIPVYRDGDTRALRSVLAGLAPGIDPEDRVTLARFDAEFFDRDYAAALDALARMDRQQLESQVVFYPKPLLAGLAHQFAGSPQAARVAYDSARVTLEGKLAERPDDQRLHEALSRAYAGLGRRDDAIQAGLRAVELWPASKDSFTSREYVLALAWTYATVGEHGAAIEQLESYLSGPGAWSIEGLLLDPRIDPLRDHPRFQALLEREH